MLHALLVLLIVRGNCRLKKIVTNPEWIARFEADLTELDRAGLRRRPLALESGQGRVVRVDGRELVNFCSNDYLGLAGHPRVKEAAAEAIHRWGWGSGASRLISGTLGPHLELESALAEFKRGEAALSFSSGYAANLATIPCLVGPADAVYCDRLNHASLVDACRLSRARLRVYPHGDLEFLERHLDRDRGPDAGRQLVVTESVFSMDGDLADLSGLGEICRRRGALLYVDDAHGLGVLGEGGRGAECMAPAHVVMGTFSKALGGVGAFIATARAVTESVLHRGRAFVYSTAPPPAVAAAALEALRILAEEPERRAALRARADQLARGLGRPVPAAIGVALTGENEAAVAAAAKLREQGLLVVAIRPPTVPRGTARLRMTLRADHTEDDVARLVAALRELGLAP